MGIFSAAFGKSARLDRGLSSTSSSSSNSSNSAQTPRRRASLTLSMPSSQTDQEVSRQEKRVNTEKAGMPPLPAISPRSSKRKSHRSSRRTSAKREAMLRSRVTITVRILTLVAIASLMVAQTIREREELLERPDSKWSLLSQVQRHLRRLSKRTSEPVTRLPASYEINLTQVQNQERKMTEAQVREMEESAQIVDKLEMLENDVHHRPNSGAHVSTRGTSERLNVSGQMANRSGIYAASYNSSRTLHSATQGNKTSTGSLQFAFHSNSTPVFDPSTSQKKESGRSTHREGHTTISAASSGTGISFSSLDSSDREATEKEHVADSPDMVLGDAKDDGKFRGVPLGIIDGDDITKISFMLFRIITTYSIKSMIDMPCSTSTHWMPKLLERLDYEVLGFRYYGVDTTEEGLEKCKRVMSDYGEPKFLVAQPENKVALPDADLVFSWDGIQNWGIRPAWLFFKGMRRSNVKFVLFCNNPGINNLKHRGQGLLNVRRPPFHFAEAVKVVGNISYTDKPKQLLFYDIDSIRPGII